MSITTKLENFTLNPWYFSLAILSHNSRNISGLIFRLKKLIWRAAQGTSKQIAVNDKSFIHTSHPSNKTKIWFSAPLITTFLES
jgi:hypothetical protein